MKKLSDMTGQRLGVVAAAVLLALGSATAIAQQGAEPQSEEAQDIREAGSEAAQEVEQETGEAVEEGREAAEDIREEAADAAEESDQDAREEESERTEVARAEPSTGQGNPEQIDELGEENEDLSTFVEAVKAAGLAESLTDGTNYTVFAPSNEAFESMSGTSVEELMQPENREQLVGLLRAHIVADDVDAERAKTLTEAMTLDGETIEISEENGELKVGDATVVEADIEKGSLRVHVIDGVLSEGGSRSAAAEDEDDRA